MTKTIPLGEVVHVSAGQPAPKPSEMSDDGHPFIRAGSLERLLHSSTEDDCEKIGASVAKYRRLKLYPKDTVVFAKSGMSAKIGRIYRLRQPSYVVSHLATLVPTGKYDPSFLTHWLRRNSPSRLIHDHSYPSIRISEISGLGVPDLQIGEQRRIADILDKTDVIRREIKAYLNLANRLLQSTFLKLFGDPVNNPRGWPIATVNNLGVVQSGLQVSRKRNTLPMRRPYLRVANVFRDELILSEIKEIGLTKAEFSRTKLKFGDVLIVEGHGNPNEIGRTCVWDGSINGCVHQNHLIRFRPDRNVVSPIYLSRLLNSQGGRLQLIAAARTTSGLNTISTTKVRELRIPLPPIEEQHEFERFVAAQEQIVTQARRARAEAARLFSSLSQGAFRGEL